MNVMAAHVHAYVGTGFSGVCMLDRAPSGADTGFEVEVANA